ncbi:MAG: hypothetical protein ACK5QX_05495, partial [bacterium]
MVQGERVKRREADEPQAVTWIWSLKPNGDKSRPLETPAILDGVVQTLTMPSYSDAGAAACDSDVERPAEDSERYGVAGSTCASC